MVCLCLLFLLFWGVYCLFDMFFVCFLVCVCLFFVGFFFFFWGGGVFLGVWGSVGFLCNLYMGGVFIYLFFILIKFTLLLFYYYYYYYFIFVRWFWGDCLLVFVCICR